MRATWLTRLTLLILGGLTASFVVRAEDAQLPNLTVWVPATVSDPTSAIASADADGLASVTFQIDGADVGLPIINGACRYVIDPAPLSDGPHTVSATAVTKTLQTVRSNIAAFTVSHAGPTPAPTPTPTPTPSGQAPLLVQPAVGTVIAAAQILAEVTYTAGPTAVTFQLRSLAGAVVQSWPFTVANTSTRFEKMLAVPVSTINGQYDFVAIVGAETSPAARITLTCCTPAPTPTPTPTPTPVPSNTIDTVAGQVTVLDAKVTSADTFTRTTLAALQGAFSSGVTLSPAQEARIQSVIAVEIAKAVQPVVVTPPTCTWKNEANPTTFTGGDGRLVSVRIPIGCPVPAKGATFQVIR